MPSTLLIGPPNSGKTQKLLELFLKDEAAVYLSPNKQISEQIKHRALTQSEGKSILESQFPSPSEWCMQVTKGEKNLLKYNQALLLCFKALKKEASSTLSETQLFHTAQIFLRYIQKLKRHALKLEDVQRSVLNTNHLFDLFLKTFRCYEHQKDEQKLHDEEDVYLHFLSHLQHKKELPFSTLYVDHFFAPSFALKHFLSLMREHYPCLNIYLAWETFEARHGNIHNTSAELLEQIFPSPDFTIQCELKEKYTPNTSFISVAHQNDEELFVVQTLLGEEDDLFHPPTVCLHENKSFEENIARHLSSLDVQANFFPCTPTQFPQQLKQDLESLLKLETKEESISHYVQNIMQHMRKSTFQKKWKNDFRLSSFQAEISRSYSIFSTLEKILKELEASDKLFSLPKVSSHFMLSLIITLCEKTFSIPYQAFQNTGMMFKKYRQGNANSRDKLILPQCSENHFPQVQKEHDIFNHVSFSDKEIEHIFHENAEIKDAAEKYLFLMWVEKVREEIIFSFSEKNTEGKENQASEYLSELHIPTQITPIPFIHPHLENDAFAKHLSLQVALEHERQFHNPKHLEYHGVLQESSLLEEMKKIIERKPLRITALETFAKCPFRFFLDYILKIKEKEEEDILDFDPRHRGTLLHHLLEVFYKTGKPAHKAEEIQAQLSEISATAFAEKEIPKSPLQNLWENELIKTSSHLLLHELAKKNELEDPLVPQLFELAFGNEEYTFTLQLDGQKSIALSGRIDRIDVSHSGGKIALVDYKSGREEKKLRSLIEEGKHLQLPLYAHAIKKLYPEFKAVGLKIVSTQDPEAENALILKDENKKHFGFSPRSRSLIKEEVWEELLEGSLQYSKAYISEILAGHFMNQELEQCSHCRYQAICRMKPS